MRAAEVVGQHHIRILRSYRGPQRGEAAVAIAQAKREKREDRYRFAFAAFGRVTFVMSYMRVSVRKEQPSLKSKNCDISKFFNSFKRTACQL